MKRWSLSEKEEILQAAQEGDTVEVCRKYGVSTATYYVWKRAYDTHGLEGLKSKKKKDKNVSLTKAEEEIRMLRKLLVDKELELELQKELLKKKFGTDEINKI